MPAKPLVELAPDEAPEDAPATVQPPAAPTRCVPCAVARVVLVLVLVSLTVILAVRLRQERERQEKVKP